MKRCQTARTASRLESFTPLSGVPYVPIANRPRSSYDSHPACPLPPRGSRAPLPICVHYSRMVFATPRACEESQAITFRRRCRPFGRGLVRRIKRQHPRLLIDAAGFEALRKRIAADPVLKQWDIELRHDADRCLTAKLPEHVLPDGKRLLDTSRRMLQHSYTLAMAYRLHGDRRYLDRLWQELQTVASVPRFQSAALPRYGRNDPCPGHRLRLALRPVERVAAGNDPQGDRRTGAEAGHAGL